MLNSCATILVAGKADECQRKKPGPGELQREVRVGYLIFDLLVLGIPFTVADFLACEINYQKYFPLDLNFSVTSGKPMVTEC